MLTISFPGREMGFSNGRRLSAERKPLQAHLLQFVGLGLVFVPVGILPVGQTEGPHRQDAVNVVSDPGVWLIWSDRQETCYGVLSGTDRSKVTDQQ